MDLAAAQPYWRTRQLPTECLPAIAANDVGRHRGGTAARKLASLREPNRSKVGSLFDRALNQVGVARMTDDEAWTHVARDLAHRILAGQTEPCRGARLLTLAWSAAPALGELWMFQMLDREAKMCKDRPGLQGVRADIVQAARRFVISTEGEAGSRMSKFRPEHPPPYLTHAVPQPSTVSRALQWWMRQRG
jgi:hypothetical protein